jgi:hypothetical protein
MKKELMLHWGCFIIFGQNQEMHTQLLQEIEDKAQKHVQ